MGIADGHHTLFSTSLRLPVSSWKAQSRFLVLADGVSDKAKQSLWYILLCWGVWSVCLESKLESASYLGVSYTENRIPFHKPSFCDSVVLHAKL